jgi:hypothetical protein
VKLVDCEGRLRALAALGIAIIMVGATYYHSVYTPIVQAVPAFVLLILSGYIFWIARAPNSRP